MELKSQFEKAFIELSKKGPEFPWELISFCMHTFKWESLKNNFESLLNEAKTNNDLRAQPILIHILESFEDTWEDIDLHPYYSEPKNH